LVRYLIAQVTLEATEMTVLERIEAQVQTLSAKELHEFRRWFQEWDADAWDRQIEADAQAGKLDALAAEALVEYRTGSAREI
jgi:hypothetical protein